MMRTRTKEQRSIEENNRRQEYTEEMQYKEKKVSKTCCTSDNWRARERENTCCLVVFFVDYCTQ